MLLPTAFAVPVESGPFRFKANDSADAILLPSKAVNA
jgi:hypothetical protein